VLVHLAPEGAHEEPTRSLRGTGHGPASLRGPGRTTAHRASRWAVEAGRRST
jgi:hypothetical protein